jgi:hypothetical protein
MRCAGAGAPWEYAILLCAIALWIGALIMFIDCLVDMFIDATMRKKT